MVFVFLVSLVVGFPGPAGKLPPPTIAKTASATPERRLPACPLAEGQPAFFGGRGAAGS